MIPFFTESDAGQDGIAKLSRFSCNSSCFLLILINTVILEQSI